MGLSVLPIDRLLTRTETSSNSTAFPVINGYAARATWQCDQPLGSTKIGRSIRSFKASWRVPDPPTTELRQILYLFMGMETGTSVGNKVILQPVLQWGANELKYWSVAIYCVSGSPGNLKLAATTGALRVVTGDNLTASIKLQGKVGGAFGYVSEFIGIPGSLQLSLPRELVQTGVALEAYNVMKLSDLPSSELTAFNALEIILDDDTKASPNWQLTNPELKYNIRASPVVHGGVQDEIDIYYH